MKIRWVAGALVPLALAMGSTSSLGAESYQSQAGSIVVVTVAEGLEQPWGLAFLPDGRMLVTEKEGRLRLVSPDGTLSEPLAGVPEVYDNGQGGLLDVALDPDFAANQLVYLSFAEPGGEGGGTAVARGTLGADRLDHVEVIWRQQPKLDSGQHFGSRLVFLKDGTLIVTLGDRNRRQYIPDMKAQIGKLVRINRDGSIPKDNPFVGNADYSPDIYSLGHRNVQGATLHPDTGALWTVEHGARGGDEINIPQPGKNYGWPVISYGREYSGEKIGEGTTQAGPRAAGLLLGPLDRAVGHDLLHRRQVSGLEGQPVRRRAEVPAAGAAGGRRQPHRQGGAPARGHGRSHPRRGAGAGRLSLPADRRG